MTDKDLYLSNGYLNVNAILETGYTFIMIIGARGIGKTYGFAKRLLVESQDDIVYMRRTKTEIDIATSPQLNAFSSISEDTGAEITFGKLKYGKTLIVDDIERGYALPLSTFSNVRGINAQRIKWILFDEFIPEHMRHYKINDSESFKHAYETLNRNRELNGAPPIRCIFLANSNNLENDFFTDLDLVNVIGRLSKSGIQIYEDPARGLMVLNLTKSPISKLKANTALYRLTGGASNFDNLALSNAYTELAQYHVKSMSLNGFKPIWRVGSLNFYRNSQGVYYCTSHESGAPKIYEASDSGYKRFCDEHSAVLYAKYIKNKLWFETPREEVLYRVMDSHILI